MGFEENKEKKSDDLRQSQSSIKLSENSNQDNILNSTINKSLRKKRPDQDLYVPRNRRSQTTPRSSHFVADIKQRSDPENYQIVNNQPKTDVALISNYKTNDLKKISLVKQVTIDNSECDILVDSCNMNNKNISAKMATTKNFHDSENATNGLFDDKDETNKDETKLKKEKMEINSSSKRTIQKILNPDDLKVDTRDTVNENTSTKNIETEQDDWENMFDEKGDCLDPKMMDELTAHVGKVDIETPKTDYKLYQTKQALLLEEEFPHVLEASNFPVEFKTQDLIMTFSAYKDSGFDIKWVDDTHALIVFSNSKIAAEVLSTKHAFVTVKPLKEAKIESRNKAKKCSSSLQPYRQRPETCAALARRLVTGALGVRLKTSREERENERRILNEARKRKLLATKQSEEMWED
ncbi:coiled-coil domain-containing protein R3HCC1L [Culicoides brevitarsis]|uniref:coiled-coil domain-containing protein R3HCC1L n=1 Tax=Culicoides brevitarsis TaxID=469753 RepID=UPI00307B4916